MTALKVGTPEKYLILAGDAGYGNATANGRIIECQYKMENSTKKQKYNYEMEKPEAFQAGKASNSVWSA